MTDLKLGDRVRIKDRNDWWLPTEYKLAGARGRIAEILDEAEGLYVAVEVDEDRIGVDKRVRVGLRIEAVEKIEG